MIGVDDVSSLWKLLFLFVVIVTVVVAVVVVVVVIVVAVVTLLLLLSLSHRCILSLKVIIYNDHNSGGRPHSEHGSIFAALR